MSINYRYAATVVGVVDGDTLKLDIDLGLRVHLTDNVRLAGIDAPETRGPKASEEGKIAKAFVEDLAGTGTEIEIATEKYPGKYGRWIAEVFLPDGRSLNEVLVETGHAERWG